MSTTAKVVAGIVGLVVVIGLIAIISASYYINPGNVGVLVLKAGQNAKGVSDKPLTPGWGFRELFVEDVVEYPTFLQTAIWTKSTTEGDNEDQSITTNSKEGTPVNLDATMSFTLEADKIPDLYVKFRTDINSIESTYLRQTVRQAIQDVFGQYSIDDIYGPKKTEIISKVQGALVDKLSSDGFNIQQFTINEIRLPQNIVDAINQKIQAQQAVLTAEQNLQKAEVDASTTVAQAEAQAESIKIQAAAIESQGGADYVKLQAINKWNGVLPTQMFGAATPFVSIGQ